ncbi:hypothetical protein Tco_0897987 [Tanacetum coccineum]
MWGLCDPTPSSSMDSFQGLTPKAPHHGIDLWLQIQFFMIMSRFILRMRLIASPTANSVTRTLKNLGKSLRTSLFTTMRARMIQGTSAKPVKAISTSQSTSKTPDRRLLELEDQIMFLLKKPQTAPGTSSTYIPKAHVKAVTSYAPPRSLNHTPRQNSFTFRERVRPNPQPKALDTSFEARVRDYMATHTERMERFQNAIFKQQQEINDKMAEMFKLLKELTTSRTLEKVLVREEARHPITKHVNSISLIRMEDEKSVRSNRVVGEDKVEPNKSDLGGTLEEVDGKGEVENRTNNELARNTKEDLA